MGLKDRTPPTPAEYDDYRERFSNWGRWGDGDELGTLNFIDQDVRRAAAQLVREGRAVSLSRPLDTHASPANPYPAHHFVAVGQSGGMADYFGLFIHGVTNTHIDALSHLSTLDGRRFYNGGEMGAYHLPAGRSGTIEHWREGIVTRGVLYDVPRLRGAEYVEPGSPVHGWDLEDAAAAQGIEPREGDAVIVRSAADPYYAATGATRVSARRPGCTPLRSSSSTTRGPRCWSGTSWTLPPPTRASPTLSRSPRRFTFTTS